MQLCLENKQIILGVTGGIAAYKSADLVRRLREAGASVRVVMTENAKAFITPLTMQAVSSNPVHDGLFDVQAEAAMGHIELARWADAVIVAPGTADFIARLNAGMANDLLTTLCLATVAPIFIAPAMNQAMWKHTLTQKNLQALNEKNQITILPPTDGSQACGDVGMGRMMEPLTIVEELSRYFAQGVLANKTVVITAGPTREAIDPVRYISNASSGKMGFALAAAAAEAHAKVILISGPVDLANPPYATVINVTTAQEMHAAVMQAVKDADIFISVAAVSDYRCKSPSTHKIAKTKDTLILELEKNHDIIADVANLSRRPLVIGFAAETENVLEKAEAKLRNKKLDMIIANQVGGAFGIGSDDNAVTILWGENKKTFPRMNKKKLARELITHIAELIYLPLRREIHAS